MTALAAAPAPADWEAWACLAMGSAVGVGAVNFLSEYNKQAGWRGLRVIIATHRWNLIGLAVLEAVTGITATLIVVGLGVTKPTWLDEPLGWFLLGTVGPAIAAASIASIRVGGQSHELGLSLLYSPVRDMLLKPDDDVEKRFTAVLNDLCGKPTDDDREAISVPARPADAAGPPSAG
jgi:hypothetical protein